MLTKPPFLPKLPGVYLFKDAQGRVLYVGKARLLSQRVASYFSHQAQPDKIAALLQEATSLEHIVTHSETDALLLEEHLIKCHQPRYNILLSSGQPFLYLHITHDAAPELKLTRTRSKMGDYWGPFVQRSVVRRAHEYLTKRFQLLRCTRSTSNGCLKYHLGICAGVCTGSFDEEAYRTRMELVRAVLNGDTEQFTQTLNHALHEAQQKLAFEHARQLYRYAEDLEEIFATIRAAFTPKTYQSEITRALTSSADHAQRIQIYQDAAKALQQLLHTDKQIHTIDCFDISHHQGRHIVGSSIRFVDGVPDRSAFRRFKIKTLTEQNDYAALQEIVTRRYRNIDSIPDLILIDGGKGQLSAVQQVVPTALVISIAKREERIFTPHHKEGILLDQGSPLGRLLISLRNYAHHFALTYHSLLKRKELYESPTSYKRRTRAKPKS